MTDEKPPESIDLIISKLDEVLFWLRVSSMSAASQHFAAIFDTEEKHRAYQLTDGINTLQDIRKEVPISLGTLHSWWEEWQARGIVRESPHRKVRREKLLDLRSLGLV
jgi:transposase-like protein